MFREISDRLIDTSEVEDLYEVMMKSLRTGIKDKMRIIYDKVCNEDGSVSSLFFLLVRVKEMFQKFGNFFCNKPGVSYQFKKYYPTFILFSL